MQLLSIPTRQTCFSTIYYLYENLRICNVMDSVCDSSQYLMVLLGYRNLIGNVTLDYCEWLFTPARSCLTASIYPLTENWIKASLIRTSDVC